MLKHIADVLIAFGPIGVFLIGFLDSLGIPLPAVLDALLIAVAIKTPNHGYLAAGMAVVGSVGGNILLFRTARLGGRRFLRAETPPGERRRFREWFHRYGLLTIFIPAVVPFVPLPLKVFVISAGAMHTPIGRFLGVIFAARVIRYFGEAYLGIRLGQDAGGFLQRNGWNLVAVLVAAALVMVVFVKWYDRRRSPVQ